MMLSESECPTCKKMVPLFKVRLSDYEVSFCRLCGTAFLEQRMLDKISIDLDGMTNEEATKNDR